MAARTEPTLTPKFRLAWPNLAKTNDKGKYSISMLFDKDTDIKALKRLVAECIKGEWGDKFKPAQLTLPFKDGNLKTDDDGNVRPEYEDVTYADANTKFSLVILDGTNGKKPIPAAEVEGAVYAGCYCIAQVSAYAWEHKDEKTNKVIKRGVSFQLENLMKMGDGERLGGGTRHSAEDAFADVEVEASFEDASNYNDDDGYDL